RAVHPISAAESAMAWARDHGGSPPDLTIRDGRRVTRHLYGRQRRNGEIIFGGDRELKAYDATPDPKGIDVNRDHAISVLPFLAGAPIARTWAGLMPFPRDGKPLIGRIPGRDNLWIVTGLASSGFGRGPMAGKLLADYLHRHAERRAITPAVRTPGCDPAFILRLLDMGVQGIQVPHISDARAAREAVKAVRYAPLGDRGMAGASRASEFGKIPLKEHMEQSN